MIIGNNSVILMFKMKRKEKKDFEKLMRNNMECSSCGRELKQVSKKKYRKWNLGELFFLCKECKKV